MALEVRPDPPHGWVLVQRGSAGIGKSGPTLPTSTTLSSHNTKQTAIQAARRKAKKDEKIVAFKQKGGKQVIKKGK